ncbi:MAG: sensor histidine kinase [Acidobacteria bacterium]|nr:sensor histidine kinase [Acidobacteriota bacterium]
MVPRQITRQRIFRVMIAGFGLVILLLAAAAVVGIRNIDDIQETARGLLREQSVSRRLIDELQSQQTSLSEVFGILARDPDSVDYTQIMAQLDEADRDIDRIAAEGEKTPDRALWTRLRAASRNFSSEARRLLSVDEPETFQSMDLFRYHGAFASVVARLLEAEYTKLNAAQTEIDRRTARLSRISFAFAGAALLLALVFAVFTVRMVAQLVERLEWQTAELSRVSWHMLEAQEDTARRFSHELHDELGQSLTAVKTNLAAMQHAGCDPARLGDCLRLVDESIGNVRQMSQLLRPTILDDFGLEAGLRWLAEGFQTRTGIEVAVESAHPARLPDETETHLFRIAQEALTNVARHAHAKRVDIRLEPAPGGVRLRIADDGRGLAPGSANGRGLGMIGMRARARSAGGDVAVESKPGRGVVIEVRVPVHNEANTNLAG